MKKLFAFIAVLGMLSIGASFNVVMAQEEPASPADTTVVDTTIVEQAFVEEAVVDDTTTETEDQTMHQILKQKFIEGGAGFMGVVLLALILGLAIAIERIIYLSLATTNTKKLLAKIETALNEEGVDAAKEICRNTRGPVASIFYQGLDRYDGGLEVVEKSIIAYGSVQMGLLEKGLTWISLFISIAPMLGFMGTVIGMIGAFDSIQQAGEISASLVAGGIKVALITTVTGLTVAMILQLFYNYCLTKIDGITNDMEDSSISFMDMLIEYQQVKK